MPSIPFTSRWLALAMIALPSSLFAATTDTALPWHDATQMIVVVTPDWDSTDGTLQKFERTGDAWHAVEDAVAISVGRSGAAWGLGLHPAQTDGPQKREGDGRSPAGVFALGDAFGYATTADTTLPYQAMQASSYCMDVPASPHYNRIVDSNVVGQDAVEGSTEPMRLDLHKNGDPRYQEGWVILHNPDNIPGAGSCIFAHLWRQPGETTAGCTAMSPSTMQAALAWLKPEANPVFVLLPEAEYTRLKSDWQLP